MQDDNQEKPLVELELSPPTNTEIISSFDYEPSPVATITATGNGPIEWKLVSIKMDDQDYSDDNLKVDINDESVNIYWINDLISLFPLEKIKYLYDFHQKVVTKWDEVPEHAQLIEVIVPKTNMKIVKIHLTATDGVKTKDGEYIIKVIHNYDSDRAKLRELSKKSRIQFNIDI